MIPGIAAKLAGRLGISEGTARTLAAAAIPVIMNMMNGQVNQAQKGGLDIGSMIGGLMGGGACRAWAGWVASATWAARATTRKAKTSRAASATCWAASSNRREM
jgi:hypothetical protein